MIAYISGLGFWNWLFLGVALIVLETVLPGVHLLWFGLAAVTVGAIVYALGAAGHPELLTWPWQLVAFAAVSLATVFWVRRAADAGSTSDVPDLNVRAAQYVGRVVVVEEAIAGGRGKVRVGDTLWVAKGTDTPAGTKVRITGVDGTVFAVEGA